MSNKATMTVLYFTDGALIEDLRVRRSLLRIPEIIKTLREHQDEFLNCDLFISMMDQSLFDQLNFHQKFRLKNLLQNSLYERWRKNGGEPDLIVRRSDYTRFVDVADVFAKLTTLDHVEVVTIGPGFDELEAYLRLHFKMNNPLPHYDLISQDPQLQWFWDDVKNAIELHS